MAEETTECSLSLIDNLKQACNEDFLSLATRVFQRKQALIRSFPNLEEGVTSRSWENAGHSSNADSSLAQTDSADEVEVVNDTESVTSPELPPKAALYRPPLEVGKVYIVKKISSRRNEWSKALLLSIIYNVRKGVTNNRCLVKYSDGTISSRHVEASEVAYLEDCPTMIPVGTAVVTNTTSSNVAHYYAGVVLELPNALNNFRYLVFLDKGSVCYTHHNELRVICDVYQAHNAHTIDRYFVRDWLSFYPDRFLSKFKIGEKAEVKRRSGWAEGTVQCVDCSIVQLRFSDGSLEWYSRGSYKFKKIIYGQPSSSHPPKYLQRLQRIREKNALEMNQEPEDGPSLSQTQLVPARSLSTHRIPSLPQHSVSDPLKMITPLLSWWPKDLGMHACNTSCVPGEEIIKRIDPKYGVLVWPLCIGFKRQNQGFMSYKAPCGQVLKNYAQLRRFLDRTKLSLNYEHFDFSTRINALRVYDPDPNSILASLDDISNGLEKCSISCINEVNNQLPETIAYMTKRKFLTYSDELMSNCGDFVSCCSCEDDCKDPAKCECIQLTINSYLAVDDLDKPLAPSEIVYQYKRLLNEVRSGIYECNQRCKCSSACPNRLVQFPLSAQLQLFQTGKKGWGVRALHDLPKGSFVCTYVGVLLNEREANEWGILHGDEYLSDLDFIEKQESFKPGYEDSVAELSDANASSSTGVANTRSSELDQRLQSEENDHEPPKRRRSSRAHSQTPVETKKRRTTSKKRVDQEFPRGSIKRFFPADFSEFTIDAKNAGNIGRYFNLLISFQHVDEAIKNRALKLIHDVPSCWVVVKRLSDDEISKWISPQEVDPGVAIKEEPVVADSPLENAATYPISTPETYLLSAREEKNLTHVDPGVAIKEEPVVADSPLENVATYPISTPETYLLSAKEEKNLPHEVDLGVTIKEEPVVADSPLGYLATSPVSSPHTYQFPGKEEPDFNQDVDPGVAIKKEPFMADEIMADSSLEDVSTSVISAPETYQFSAKEEANLIEGEKPYACDQCSYRSKTAGRLQDHERTHTGEKPYACDQCSFRSTQEVNLRTHKRTHTGEKPYACDQCSYRTTQESNLRRHKRIHTGEKPFACDQCSFRSTQEDSLRTHKRSHTGEKPYACDQCSYRTADVGNLRRHKRTHTGEKPYACDQCSYRSTRAGHIRTHKRTHTGEKPYACNQCNYRTANEGDLQKHKRTHTGEKPYACDQCSYRSKTASHLHNHKRTHSG